MYSKYTPDVLFLADFGPTQRTGCSDEFLENGANDDSDGA